MENNDEMLETELEPELKLERMENNDKMLETELEPGGWRTMTMTRCWRRNWSRRMENDETLEPDILM